MKPRKTYRELYEQKNSRKISTLIGPRQVGKTTLLKALHEELKEQELCLFLDLDIYSNYERVSTFEGLQNTLRLAGYDGKKRCYLFLDEFQRYPGLTIILKNAYDNLPNLKIYASGSSSLKIKSEVQESLAGRKVITIVNPLDFEEFLWFKEDTEALAMLKNSPKLKGDDLFKITGRLYHYLEEFLVFGGYPEVVLSKDKEEVLGSIFDLFVKKDLREYLKVEKLASMKRLIEILAVNNGKKLKFDTLSQSCSLFFKEVKDYIEVLKESHIVEEVRPFYTNKNSELVKIPKFYFLDNGVRNYFVNNFNILDKREDAPFLFEGFIISELVKKGVGVRFWQDKNKHEVDVIIEQGKMRIPVEIKFKKVL
ncbi:MAG: ATP-binding protein, partial [Nanoarchaeota archaeon]